MTIKKLFDQSKEKVRLSQKFKLSNVTIDSLVSNNDLESEHQLHSHAIEIDRYVPDVDYSDPSNFARFGFATDYYDNSIKFIYNTYPYDGSVFEKAAWHNSASHLDNWIFEHKYPRTTGYAIFSPAETTTTSVSGGYGNASVKEYIYLKGGPHKDSSAESLKKAWPEKYDIRREAGSANYYHTASNRDNNLDFNLSSSGVTVEFWLKKKQFVEASTANEIVLDLWNGTAASSVSSDYGRLRIELTGASGPFLVTALSGTAGFSRAPIGTGLSAASIADNSWHHYSFTLKNEASNVEVELYRDGKRVQTIQTGSVLNPVTGALQATIGSLITSVSGAQGTYAALGWGKLSASLDEFRFWKVKRDPKQIGQNWFSQVGGGTNTDSANTALGVYYKFNEGTTASSSVDSIVLDYSGRITNGSWIGYSTAGRNSGSAIDNSGYIEFKDPIMRSAHSDIISLKKTLKMSGSVWDLNNNSNFNRLIPSWLLDDDLHEGYDNLKGLIQITAYYLDDLSVLMDQVPKFKEISYASGSANRLISKPKVFADRLLKNSGFQFDELFVEASALEELFSKNPDTQLKEKVDRIKNLIYTNIYNNLNYLYKTKGTFKSIRNLLHCIGIGEDIIKFNLYADNLTYKIRENFKLSEEKSKLIDFNHSTRFDGTVYQYPISSDSETVSFISGSNLGASPTLEETKGLGFTYEGEFVFPRKPSRSDTFFIDYDYTDLTASLFGVHTAQTTNANDTTWASTDDANFQVYAVRPQVYSDHTAFVLTSSHDSAIPLLTSKTFKDVYDNNKWNLSVRISPANKPWATMVPGTSASTGTEIYTVDFFGTNYNGDQKNNEFHVSGTITRAQVTGSLASPRRVYAGAHYQDFTSSVMSRTDVRVNNVKVWAKYLSNEELRAHARFDRNIGAADTYQNIGLFNAALQEKSVPSIATLLFNWDFSNLTGSDAAGRITVYDTTSGSVEKYSRYGWLSNIVDKNYSARADFLPASSTDVIDIDYLTNYKQVLPDSISSEDMVKVMERDDVYFTKDSRPINYFFSIEKNLYQAVSEEMMQYFATIKDFSNLYGEPVNRYRQEYKQLGKLRQLFFERIGNTPDLEKFINYYKWFDDAVSSMIENFIPASARNTEDINTVIESHVLERNKYWNKFPTLEPKINDPESALKGIEEQAYNWKYGHAPDKYFNFSAATATILGRATLDDATGTSLILRNSDGSTVTFTTNPAKNFGDTVTETASPFTVNTRDISSFAEDRKATQALWISCKAAIDARKLDMTIDPTSFAGYETSFTLTQATAGAAGNTTITLITGVSADGETTFTGGIGSKDDSNCFWWKDRAERSGDSAIKTGNTSLDSNRQDINTARITEVTGSTYVQRALSRPYRFIVDRLNTLSPSSDKSENKKEHFYKQAIKFGNSGRISIPQSYIEDLKPCEVNDTITPPELKKNKWAYRAETSLEPSGSYLSGKGNLLTPFVMYSSSVASGYKSQLAAFKDGSTAINNLHQDTYENMHAPMQGPFTERWVGGSQHRHIKLNYANSNSKTGSLAGVKNVNNLDAPINRPEAFDISIISGSEISIKGIDSINTAYPRATYFRDEVAKRPLNIKNILMTSSSPTIVGNYTKRREYFQTAGRDVNNLWWRSGSSGEGGFNQPTAEQLAISGTIDFTLPDRGTLDSGQKNQTVIAERFSAPGGPETMGRGFLDTYSETYSVYNALPYRNLIVRTNLNTWMKHHSTANGIYDAVYGSPTASYHHINSNKGYRIELSSNGTAFTASVYDNGFVTHQVPQSDSNYSWIKDSLSSSAKGVSCPLGFVESFDGTVSSSLGYVQAITFFEQSQYVNFADAQGTLNSIILQRQGPYGWPSWKQTRVGNYPIVKERNKRNELVIDFPKLGVVKNPRESKKVAMSPVVHNKPSFCSLKMKTGKIIDGQEATVLMKFKIPLQNLNTTFDDASLRAKLGIKRILLDRNGERNQPYDKMRDLYQYKSVPSSSSPVSEFVDFSYSDFIYPKKSVAFLSGTYTRENFSVEYWKNKRKDRESNNKINSMNFVILSQSVWDLDGRQDTAYKGYTMSSFNANTVPTGAHGELLNQYSIYHMGNTSKLTASALYSRPIEDNQGTSANKQTPIVAGDAIWEAGAQSGKILSAPFYESYEDYADALKFIGKSYSLVPEFRISEHMHYYINNKYGNFLADNPAFLTLTGSAVKNSATASFMKTYSTSDFLQMFSVVRKDHEGFAKASELTLECKALKKFLPYNGFYPAQRTKQLAQLFSQSYGSTIVYSGSQTNFRTLNTPLFAPGILYNSVKSAIAVDYPIYTGSYTIHNINNDSTIPMNYEDYHHRIPFEALVDPEFYIGGINIADAEPHPSASINSTASLPGAGSETYRMAMHNFLAEVPNFFLKDNGLTTFASADDRNSYVVETYDGTNPKEYKMRIVVSHAKYRTRKQISDLFKARGTSFPQRSTASWEFNPPTIDIYRRFPSDPSQKRSTGYNYGSTIPVQNIRHGSSFGPPTRATQTFFAGVKDGSSQTSYGSPEYTPFTPPYYDGYSEIELTFKPTQEGEYSLNEVLGQTTHEVRRLSTGQRLFESSDIIPTTSDICTRNAMQLTSSLNFLQKANVRNVRADAAGNPISINDPESPILQWIIQPKWETPVIDFSGSSVTLPSTGTGSVPLGLWHQYGRLPLTSEAGLFMSIQDPQRAEMSIPARTGSLADLVGFKKGERRLGQVAGSKEVYEAIIAVPFVRKPNGKMQFYSIDRSVIELLAGEITAEQVPVGQLKNPGASITEMVRKMKRYVIPPKLDFVTNKSIQPFAMYLFEFKHTFTQKDLSDIWQNLPPDSLMTISDPESVSSVASISHPLLINEFYGLTVSPSNKKTIMDSKTQWLVFKVKQKAQKNYYAMTADSKDDARFKFNFNIGSKDSEKESSPDYSYNWPYDFFSMVELAQISTSVKFTRGDDPPYEDSLVMPEPVRSVPRPEEVRSPREARNVERQIKVQRDSIKRDLFDGKELGNSPPPRVKR